MHKQIPVIPSGELNQHKHIMYNIMLTGVCALCHHAVCGEEVCGCDRLLFGRSPAAGPHYHSSKHYNDISQSNYRDISQSNYGDIAQSNYGRSLIELIRILCCCCLLTYMHERTDVWLAGWLAGWLTGCSRSVRRTTTTDRYAVQTCETGPLRLRMPRR